MGIHPRLGVTQGVLWKKATGKWQELAEEGTEKEEENVRGNSKWEESLDNLIDLLKDI